MSTLIKRLSEPSTYAGLAGVSLIGGIEADQFQTLANSIAGLFGFISVILGEAKN